MVVQEARQRRPQTGESLNSDSILILVGYWPFLHTAVQSAECPPAVQRALDIPEIDPSFRYLQALNAKRGNLNLNLGLTIV